MKFKKKEKIYALFYFAEKEFLFHEVLVFTSSEKGKRPTIHAAFGWRIQCGVEVTELSTNKQHSLSHYWLDPGFFDAKKPAG